MKYRYYSTQRPFGPGTYPRRPEPSGRGGTEKITNFFRGKIFCEELGREAWGFVEYNEPLTAEEAAEYELTFAGTTGKVLEGFDESGRAVAFVIDEPEEA